MGTLRLATSGDPGLWLRGEQPRSHSISQRDVLLKQVALGLMAGFPKFGDDETGISPTRKLRWTTARGSAMAQGRSVTLSKGRRRGPAIWSYRGSRSMFHGTGRDVWLWGNKPGGQTGLGWVGLQATSNEQRALVVMNLRSCRGSPPHCHDRPATWQHSDRGVA